MQPAMTALIALRVSTESQLQNYSISVQRDDCLAYAAAAGLVVPDDGIYIDGESGATLEREQIQRCLERLRDGEAQHLIVFMLDRLTRDPADFLPLRRDLQRRGVTIHVARDKRAIADDPLDQVPDDMLVLFAKWERAAFRRRSMSGRAKKIAAGKVPGNGPAPYGYGWTGQKSTRQLVIDVTEAAVVRQVAEWFVADNCSMVDIAERLHAAGIPTRADQLGRAKKRGYAEWDSLTITNILRNETIAGVFYANRYKRLDRHHVRLCPREEWAPIQVEPILDRDTWDAVQRKLDLGKKYAPRNARRTYPLRSRIRCVCGRNYIGGVGRNGTVRHYVCAGRRSRFKGVCQMPYVPADVLEAHAYAWLCDEALSETQIMARLERRHAQHIPDPTQLARLRTSLGVNLAKQQRLLDNMLSELFPPAVIAQQQQTLLAEEQLLRREIERVQASGAPLNDADARTYRTYAALIRAGFEDLTLIEQQRAYTLLDATFDLARDGSELVVHARCLLRLTDACLALNIAIEKRTRTHSLDNHTLELTGSFRIPLKQPR